MLEVYSELLMKFRDNEQLHTFSTNIILILQFFVRLLNDFKWNYILSTVYNQL